MAVRFRARALAALALAAAVVAGALAADARPLQEPAGPEAGGELADRALALLEARCFQCHGARKGRGGLRLHERERALLGGDTGAAVTPGAPQTSELIAKITAADELDRMPPDEEALAAEEIALLRRWIEAGAPWPDAAQAGRAIGGPLVASDHWAYQPLVLPQPPQVRDTDWVRNPVDDFVLAQLEAAGIAPAPPADRETLIRRVALDLTGLPPTLTEIDAYLADSGPGAYERMVDRMLASPHYGERQARIWMDLARYADSHGFTFDDARSIWPWRDWLIGAFNADLPFDDFTVALLAGDLLPEPGPGAGAAVATGFHRNTMINQEGGADDEEFRVAAVVDRTNTTAAVWLGTTLACAQCHSHKYDPVPQRDYYRFFAFFNNTEDGGTRIGPATAVESASFRRRHQEWRNDLKAKRLELHAAGEAEPAGIRWTEIASHHEETGASGPVVLEFPCPVSTPTGLRLEAVADPAFPSGGPGLADNGNFVLNEVVLQARDAHGHLRSVPLGEASADHFQDRGATSFWPPAHAADGDGKTGWAILPQTGVDHQLVFALPESADLPAGTKLRLTLTEDYGREHRIGNLRVALTDAPGPVRALPPSPRLRAARAAFLAAQAAEPEPDNTLAMHERMERRPSFVLQRGSFLDPGDTVLPGVPEVLPQIEGDPASLTRLDLARWLVRPDHPLTWRVTVNRAWQQLFGTGIVATENDFGLRGEAPVHPELLDWLAAGFARHRSHKALFRTLVNSATYRQATTPRPEIADLDPDNRLLARQSRLRLPAEAIRDAALVASGVLVRDLGGPPVQPPQPPGVFAFTQKAKSWNPDQGDGRYRRTLYTRLWRSSPHPFLTTFDFPDASSSCTRRTRSNTPLQALTMANDPMLIELARALAARLLAEAVPDLDYRVGRAYRHALGRRPTAEETELLRDFYRAQLAAYAADTALAESAAGLVPEAGLPFEPPYLRDHDPAEAAAWTAVARVLFNLDEFVVRQ